MLGQRLDSDLPRGRPVVGLCVLCAALVLVIGSMTSLATALPVIGRSTGATQGELTWIVDAYAVTFAGLLLPAGALGDRYGRRRMLILGLVIFAAASAAGPLFGSPDSLIVVRAICGVGAALVMPASLSLITTSFREEHQDRAIGMWAAVATVAGALGIVFAGICLEVSDWRAVFHLSAVAAVAVALASPVVAESSDAEHPPLDWWGAALSAAAIGLIVFGINLAPHAGWASPGVWTCVICGSLLGVVFTRVELRLANPLLDVRVFRSRPVSLGTITLAGLFAGMFAFFLVGMQYLQLIQGRSALSAGLAVIPMAITLIPLSLAAPYLVSWAGLRAVTTAGFGALAAAFLVLAKTGDSGSGTFLLAVLLIGVSLGLCVTPATVAILHSVPASKKGVASAVNDAAREVGAAFGLAVAGTLLATGYSGNVGTAINALPEPARDQANASLAGAMEVGRLLGPNGQAAVHEARAAFLEGMHSAYLACAVFAIVSALAVIAFAPAREHRRADADVLPSTASEPQSTNGQIRPRGPFGMAQSRSSGRSDTTARWLPFRRRRCEGRAQADSVGASSD